MKKLMVIMCIVAIALFVSYDGYAAGTAAGTTITNKAIVNGANFATLTNTRRTNVRAIAGANWYAQADILPAIAGASYSNITTLSNLGNATFVFTVTVTASTLTGAGSLAGNWPWTLYTNGVVYLNQAAGGTASAPAINGFLSGATKQIKMRVFVPAGMSSSGYEQFRLTATASTHYNTAAYLGDNGASYGGAWGVYGDYIAIDGTGGIDQDIWRLTGGGAPAITIAKSITSILVADGAGPDNLAVPGATITYTIKVSNAIGAGIANAVVVRDTVNVANLIMGVAGFSGGASENQWDTRTNGNQIIWSNISAGGSIEAGNVGFLTMTAIIR